MVHRTREFGSTPQENLFSILPVATAGILAMGASILAVGYSATADEETIRSALILLGVLAVLSISFHSLLIRGSIDRNRFAWANSALTSCALGLMSLFIPRDLSHILFTLMFIAALTTSLIASRGPAFLMIFSVAAIHIAIHLNEEIPLYNWITYISLSITAVMMVETVQQLRNIARRQINRLEIINDFSRQIVYTLETSQLLSLLNATLQNALEADTYYIGIVDGADLHMQLFYDDGEYYNDLRVKREGILPNWVIVNQRPLFLSDLRETMQLEGVKYPLIGKQKSSLSWIGVPMRGTHVDGVMVISSYRANAFDKGDLELLLNISQPAVLALDNTYHHALVQREARLDSLTRVFNHGFFIQALHERGEECRALKQPLGLIMLDIDYFKKYNDRFGHLIGDEILVRLCEIIRNNIKQADVVGRWGGEEFAIALPNTNREQALQIAQRIREMLASLNLKHQREISFPIPTVSQGIAIYPDDVRDITKLIDVADKRLYIAKERGRDQIESSDLPQVEDD
jgi:diguanylate cyclase (GGDEF)-like protein